MSSDGLHKSESDPESHLTGTVKDKDQNQMYFYKVSDGTFWDRIHIPGPGANVSDRPIYVGITKEQYDR